MWQVNSISHISYSYLNQRNFARQTVTSFFKIVGLVMYKRLGSGHVAAVGIHHVLEIFLLHRER